MVYNDKNIIVEGYMKIRVICILIAALFVLPLAFYGCADGKSGGTDTTGKAAGTEADITTVTEAEDTTVHDDLPEIKFGGYTYRMLGQGGAGWTASDIIRPETLTEDGLNDAKLKRYLNIEDRFNITIETFLSETVYTTVQGAILSNDFSFDLINMDTYNTSTASLAKLLVNLNDLDYIDLSKPYYDQNYIHDMSFAGKLFSVVTDITTMDMFVTWIMMYNKNIIERNDLENPYDLVKENKWTLDKFNSMLKDVSVENGDGKWDEKDTYGFAAHTGSARNLFYAAGLTICSKDEATDIPFLSLSQNSETLTLVAEKVSDILYKDNKTLMNTQIVEAFEQGRALFLAEITGYLGRFREMEDNFGVVPYPKYNEQQERYYTTNDPCIMVFSLPAFSYKQDQLQRSEIIFEALCSESYNTVRPAYYVDVLSGKQTRDYRDYEMLDLIKNSRVYDFGLFNDLGSISTIFNSLSSTKNPKVASMLKSGTKSGEKKLNSILDKYDQIK